MNQEESTMQFDEFVKYQNWLLEFYPDMKIVVKDQSDMEDESDK